MVNLKCVQLGILKDKHPIGKDPPPCTLLNGDPEPVNPILFDGLSADTIRRQPYIHMVQQALLD